MTDATTGVLPAVQRQVERAWERSPFYRERWAAAGLTRGEVPASLEEYRERWPTVGKPDIVADQEAHPPYGRNLQVDTVDLAQVHLTSNTSGIGRELYGLTAADVAGMGESWRPQFQAIGLEPGDVTVSTLPVSFMTAGLSAVEGFRTCGMLGLSTGVVDKDWIIDALVRFDAALLYGTESFLLQLLHVMQHRGGARPHLKGLICPGGSSRLVELAEELCGCGVFEVYGCTQAAARLAITCERTVTAGSLHVCSDDHHVEVLRPDGQPAGPGEHGELVLTTLRREASPSLRFQLNDRVLVEDDCPCGQPGLVLRPMSIGRVDDMVKVRGVNVWPETVHRAVMDVAGVVEYEVRLERREDGAEQMTLRVEAMAPSEALGEEIRRRVRSVTHVRPVVRFDDDLPRYDYKARRWVDRR